MVTELRYDNPFGPMVRIGILENQEEIKFSVLGSYKVVDSEGKEQMQLQDPNKIFTARLQESRPATMQWRILLSSVTNRETALARAEMAEKKLSLTRTDIIEVGNDVIATSGIRLSARSYWVCTAPFTTEQEALEVRRKFKDASRYEILAERVAPPSGIITLNNDEPGSKKALSFTNYFELIPVEEVNSRIILYDVIVGVAYHWRHKERQKLRGRLRIIVDNKGKLTAINILPLEQYLISVNSSEMMAVCPEELLKAQTIAARNTVLATMGKHHYGEDFDLCADDHCQCYRGSSRETESSQRGVLLTLGEIITYKNEICDARYSKICGGISEDFERVWHGEPVEYLSSVFDGDENSPDVSLHPADSDSAARRLIESYPDVYCNTTRGDIPQYLRYSAPYFRWEVKYTRKQLEELIHRFPQYQIGEFVDFEALSRGPSGRIEYLLIKGTAGEVILGKQYEIRRVLSPTFLYSSCFVWDIEREANGRVKTVTLRGAGWGHGVGLCQIGAAMMAYRGKKYNEILAHYYRNTNLTLLYEGKFTRKALKEQLGEIDFRPGDACYEFFNCYAVAQCPIYLKNIRLEAQKTNGKFSFVPVNAPQLDLTQLKIVCEFLDFTPDIATPKKDVV